MQSSADPLPPMIADFRDLFAIRYSNRIPIRNLMPQNPSAYLTIGKAGQTLPRRPGPQKIAPKYRARNRLRPERSSQISVGLEVVRQRRHSHAMINTLKHPVWWRVEATSMVTDAAVKLLWLPHLNESQAPPTRDGSYPLSVCKNPCQYPSACRQSVIEIDTRQRKYFSATGYSQNRL